MSNEERRYKIVYIGETEMVEVMTALTDDGHSWVSLPIFKGLPEGFSVKSVHYEYSRRPFAVIIFHESFRIVPRWETFEAIDAGVEKQTFDMKLVRKWAKENQNG